MNYIRISNNIIFNINSFQRIEITNLCPSGHMYTYDEIKVNFHDKEQMYCIAKNDYLMPTIERFYYYIKNALMNTLHLPSFYDRDIGLLWNEYLNKKNTYSAEKIEMEQLKGWQGTNYLMWSSEQFDTWLYNKNMSIIFEITPSYPGHFYNNVDDINYTSYDYWIKSYKPVCIIEIDKKIAQKWLKKSKDIMNTIENAKNN